MIRILAMLLRLPVAPGARVEAQDNYRNALTRDPQAGIAQADRRRVTNNEK